MKLIEKDKVKKILLLQFAGLGDMVIASSVFEPVRKAYPQARIVLLTNRRSCEIVRGEPNIDEIVCIDEGLSVLLELRKERFDLVANLYRLYSWTGALKMFFVFSVIGGKIWVGRDTDKKGFFYSVKVPEQLNEKKHEVEYKTDIARAIACEPFVPVMEVRFDDRDLSCALELMEEKRGAATRPVVAVNCSTFNSSRNWTASGYAQLADLLSENLDVDVCFIGLERDKEFYTEIDSCVDSNVHNMLGAFSVRELTAFLSKVDVLVTPDSGPAHIAAALKIPQVVLFGPGEFERFRPYSSEDITRIIYKKPDCAPCFKKSCDNKICMEGITASEVFREVKELIDKI